MVAAVAPAWMATSCGGAGGPGGTERRKSFRTWASGEPYHAPPVLPEGKEERRRKTRGKVSKQSGTGMHTTLLQTWLLFTFSQERVYTVEPLLCVLRLCDCHCTMLPLT